MDNREFPSPLPIVYTSSGTGYSIDITTISRLLHQYWAGNFPFNGGGYLWVSLECNHKALGPYYTSTALGMGISGSIYSMVGLDIAIWEFCIPSPTGSIG